MDGFNHLFYFHLFQLFYVIKTLFEYSYQSFSLELFLFLNALKFSYCGHDLGDRYNYFTFEFNIELNNILYLNIRNPQNIAIRTVWSNIQFISRRIVRRHLIRPYSVAKTIAIGRHRNRMTRRKDFQKFPFTITDELGFRLFLYTTGHCS